MPNLKNTIINRFAYCFFLLFLGGLLLVISYLFARSQDYFINRDFFTFWGAGYMVRNHEDPYNPMQYIANRHKFGVDWIPNQSFLYPLPLAVLFAPLSLLSIQNASVIWTYFSILSTIISVIILIKSFDDSVSLKYLLPIIVGVIGFRPFIGVIYHGQIDSLLLLLLVIAMFSYEKERKVIASCFLPFLTLKPQIGIPVLCLVGIWLVFRKELKTIITIIITSFTIFLLGMVVRMDWLFAWLRIGQEKVDSVFGLSPTIWGISALSCNFTIHCTENIGILAVIGLLISCVLLLYYLRNRSAYIAISLIICVTLLVSPYLWFYDQIFLLIPLVFFIYRAKNNHYPYWLISATPLLFSIVSLLLVITAQKIGSDALSSSLSFMLFIMMVGLTQNKSFLISKNIM